MFSFSSTFQPSISQTNTSKITQDFLFLLSFWKKLPTLRWKFFRVKVIRLGIIQKSGGR